MKLVNLLIQIMFIMKKSFLISTAILLVSLTGGFGVCNAQDSTPILNHELCIRLLQTENPTNEDYVQMIEQCRKVVNMYMETIDNIKKFESKDQRAKTAEYVNHLFMTDYEGYNAMVKTMKRDLNDPVKASVMSNSTRAEIERLISDDKYINTMYTIFRSRYDL